jgi:DNA-binding CsgD family transcriptional regulator/tetratricopeptide (TPR) repeat protein
MVGRHQFTHALVQATLYDELTTVRRAQLHRHVGEVLETLYQAHPEPHLHRLAHHFCAAAQRGDADKAAVYAERAGAQALALLAYEEATHYYRLALLALERQEPVAEAQRRRLILALGGAQRSSGEYPQALETFRHVADLARRSGAPEDLAHAALGFEETSWRPGLPGDAAARLLHDALQALGETESPLKARVLGSLARAMVFTGALDQAAVVEKQAVEMARRLGDPATLAATLQAGLPARWRPENTATRLATTDELISLAEAAGDKDLLLHTYCWRLFDLMDLGDMPAVETLLAAHTRLAEEFRQPFYLYVNATFRAMKAIFEGRFAVGEQLAQQALTIGQRLRGQDALGVFSVQMFTLRREQGRLQELAPVVRHFVQTSPDAATWRPGLAVIYSELGLVQETRAEFERLAAHDFTDIPQDAVWVTCVAYLAEVCAFLGDVRRAAILYRFLTPFDGYNISVGPTAACYGAAARYLGMLAATMSHWDVAQRHFAGALAMNARMDARPWLAHTQHEYASMLLARGQARDHAQAVSLLDAARTSSRELGMRTLEERVLALLGQTGTQPSGARPSAAGLTPREGEVLGLIAAGKSNQEIADALCISFYTVANHVRSILAKIGAANRTEAAAYAIRHGLTAAPATPKG